MIRDSYLTKISYFQIAAIIRSRNFILISATTATLFYRPAWFNQRSKIIRETIGTIHH